MSRVNEGFDGILLVNKPAGITSNVLLQRVKRLYGVKKAGHTGSLDPMATGMLPICIGEATKFCQYLLDADKCYRATGLLGIKTNTSDAMGEVIARVDEVSVSQEALQLTLNNFLGHTQQIPSMFSALKHHGKPLYRYAREGVVIERQARDILVHDLQLESFDGRSFTICVVCSKGTYIRNLIEDVGEQLAVGAHVTELHRCYTAGFSNEPMHTLEALLEYSEDARRACLLPMDRAVLNFPRIALSTSEIQHLRQGKCIENVHTKAHAGYVRLYENDVEFVGLGEFSTGALKVKRLTRS